MTAKKCLEHSWLAKAKRAATRTTAKLQGKKKSDSCCESLSSNDSPCDISQDSTSSLDVSPLSSASSSFSPAAGKPSDDETLSTTPVKASQPSFDANLSFSNMEKSDNSDVEKLLTKRSIKNTLKEKDGEYVKKSSPVSTPTSSFGSSRSVKSPSVAGKQLPLTTDNTSVSKSASDPTVSSMSSDTTDSVLIPQTQSAMSIASKANVSNIDTSQVVLRRKARAKVSIDATNKNEEVKRRNKVNPESLPNYSRDSYRRNSLNFGESNDIDVMDFLRNGCVPSSSDQAWPPQPSPSSSGSSSSNSRFTLHPISESSGKTRPTYRDKSPKITFDAQMALLDQLEKENFTSKENKKLESTAEVCERPSSPKIAMEAIQELQSELKIGVGWPEKSEKPIDEEKQESSSTKVSQPRSERASSPKISMEAILDILQNPDCDIKIQTVEHTKADLKRKLSQPKDEHALNPKPKNLERTTEWKTLPRRRSSAKPSYIVQSKPIKKDNTKPSYNPAGPFQFLPNPNSRLTDRRGSLPLNTIGDSKLCGSSSTSQVVSRPLNGSRSSHNTTLSSLERSTTPLSFYNASSPASRSNSPLHCSPSPSSSKISQWKSCEDLDN